MKKLVTIFVTCVLIFCFTACGSNEPSINQDDKEMDEIKPDEIEDVQEEDELTTIDETLVYDNKDIKVTVKEFDMLSSIGPEFIMEFENNSSTDVTVQVDSFAVNGYMIDTKMSVDILSGEKETDSLILIEDSLKDSNIEIVADIKFDLIILETSSFARIDKSDLITLKTSNSGKHAQEYDDSGDVLYESDNIRIIAKGIKETEMLEQVLELYVENKLDKSINIHCEDISINGTTMPTIFSSKIFPNMKLRDQLMLLDSSDEENGIDNIENIELVFMIIDEESLEIIEESEMISIDF